MGEGCLDNKQPFLFTAVRKNERDSIKRNKIYGQSGYRISIYQHERQNDLYFRPQEKTPVISAFNNRI
jgi:hypothetical protein